MAEKELNDRLLREMFDVIRSDEIKNTRTKRYEDKQMVKRITDYILKQVEKEKIAREEK